MRSLTDIITFSSTFCQVPPGLIWRYFVRNLEEGGQQRIFRQELWTFLAATAVLLCEHCLDCPLRKAFLKENFEFCSLGFFFCLVPKRPTMWAQRGWYWSLNLHVKMWKSLKICGWSTKSTAESGVGRFSCQERKCCRHEQCSSKILPHCLWLKN